MNVTQVHYASNVTVGVAVNEEYRTYAQHGIFRAHNQDHRDLGKVIVTPLDGARLSLWGSWSHKIQATSDSEFRSPDSLDREIPERAVVDVSNSTRFDADEDDGSLILTGSFLVEFWESDWRVEDADGSTVYRSGQEENSATPGGVTVGSTHDRYTFFYVEDGRMELWSLHGGSMDYYAATWGAAWGQATFKDAVGELTAPDQVVPVRGDLEFPGPVNLTNVVVQDGAFHLTARTDANQVELNGTTLIYEPPALPTPTNGPPTTPEVVVHDPVGSRWWFAPLVVIVFAGLFVSGTMMRAPLWSVRIALAFHRYGYVERRTPRHFAKDATRPKAALMHAVALLGQANFKEASVFLLGLLAEDRPDDATWNYLAAWALAGNGEADAARMHVEHCLAVAPQYVREIEANPILLELLGAAGDEAYA